MAHSLAKKIQNCVESDEFDLSMMKDYSNVVTFVKEAFGLPLKLKEMIRFTFIVGGIH